MGRKHRGPAPTPPRRHVRSNGRTGASGSPAMWTAGAEPAARPAGNRSRRSICTQWFPYTGDGGRNVLQNKQAIKQQEHRSPASSPADGQRPRHGTTLFLPTFCKFCPTAATARASVPAQAPSLPLDKDVFLAGAGTEKRMGMGKTAGGEKKNIPWAWPRTSRSKHRPFSRRKCCLSRAERLLMRLIWYRGSTRPTNNFLFLWRYHS